jgi:hypothetical protein
MVCAGNGMSRSPAFESRNFDAKPNFFLFNVGICGNTLPWIFLLFYSSKIKKEKRIIETRDS